MKIKITLTRLNRFYSEVIADKLNPKAMGGYTMLAIDSGMGITIESLEDKK